MNGETARREIGDHEPLERRFAGNGQELEQQARARRHEGAIHPAAGTRRGRIRSGRRSPRRECRDHARGSTVADRVSCSAVETTSRGAGRARPRPASHSAQQFQRRERTVEQVGRQCCEASKQRGRVLANARVAPSRKPPLPGIAPAREQQALLPRPVAARVQRAQEGPAAHHVDVAILEYGQRFAARTTRAFLERAGCRDVARECGPRGDWRAAWPCRGAAGAGNRASCAGRSQSMPEFAQRRRYIGTCRPASTTSRSS